MFYEKRKKSSDTPFSGYDDGHAVDRRAFTDRTGNIEIKADWCNGNVAMTGASYGGTIPFEVAVSGVKGLKTIIPFAGIANWYDYTNAQGVPLANAVHYADSLAGYNTSLKVMLPVAEVQK